MEEPITTPKVDILVKCTKCEVIIYDRPPIEVINFWFKSEINNNRYMKLKVITKGEVTTKVSVNDKVIHHEIDLGSVIYNIKL